MPGQNRHSLFSRQAQPPLSAPLVQQPSIQGALQRLQVRQRQQPSRAAVLPIQAGRRQEEGQSADDRLGVCGLLPLHAYKTSTATRVLFAGYNKGTASAAPPKRTCAPG